MASNHLLRTAAQNGNVSSVATRLAAGDDVELRHTGTGRTPLLEAVIAGHREVVELLLDAGADIEVSCTAVGHTALGWTVVQGTPELTSLLLTRGARVDAVAVNSLLGRTPLHLAAQSGDLRLVTVLLAAGADPQLVDGRGENAWSIAAAEQHADVLAELTAAGARAPEPVDRPDPLPWPTLQWDPGKLAEAKSLPAEVSPSQVVASYIRALHAWELAAWQTQRRAAERGEHGDLLPSLATAEHLTQLHTTARERVYQRAAVGAIPDLTPEFVLCSVAELTATRHELLVRHPDPQEFVHEYEWVFVCVKRGGSWRIDAARNRLLGTADWEAAIL